jgi:ABC-type multidrug transport system permease subunit
MKRRVSDIWCVFRIHLARMRAEMGPFIVAALAYPTAMYLFARAVSGVGAEDERSVTFLAGAIVFSISLTAITWLGYLLLENRFLGRLKLFATLPLAPSSYVFGVLVFALAQAAIGTIALLTTARLFGVAMRVNFLMLAVTITLTMLCLCGLSVIIASRARSMAEGTLFTDTLGAGLVFLAPVFYKQDMLPRALSAVTEWLPTSCAARATQASLRGASVMQMEIFALALMALVTMALGFRLTKWREE